MNWTHQIKGTEGLDGVKTQQNKTQLYAAYRKFLSALKIHQAQSERIEDTIPSKWKKKKEGGNSHVYIQ